MWLRRTALICQVGAKDSTDADRLFSYCRATMEEKEFFIRKAIGWALREYAKTDPGAVAAFVTESRDDLSGLSFREATKTHQGIGFVIDPITLEVARNRFTSIAEEMGTVLRRTSLSPNIKERADCSAALFTATGEMLAQAEHIPVHLGSMPASVRACLDRFDPVPGVQYAVNDPFEGGNPSQRSHGVGTSVLRGYARRMGGQSGSSCGCWRRGPRVDACPRRATHPGGPCRLSDGRGSRR